MQPQNPNIGINLDLVDNVVDRIPRWTWPVVKDRLVTGLVDAMPTTVLNVLLVIQEVMIVLKKSLMITMHHPTETKI
jgi:hypothetical protein